MAIRANLILSRGERVAIRADLILSRGERVARDGAFIRRCGPGEGLVAFPTGILLLVLFTAVIVLPCPFSRLNCGANRRGSLRRGAYVPRLFLGMDAHFGWFSARERPLTRHAPADESAGARHPLPKGEGCSFLGATSSLPWGVGGKTSAPLSFRVKRGISL